MSEFNQWAFITPRDVWMFRDSKPFAAQAAFVARSLFPPTPQTMQGMLRTYYLDANGIDLEAYGRGDLAAVIDLIGHNAPKDGSQAHLGKLRIAGPFVARRKADGQLERLFSAPLDLQYNAVEKKFRRLVVENTAPITDAFDGWFPLSGGQQGWGIVSGWLTESAFTNYLKGDVDKITSQSVIPDDSVYQMEERPGLALDTDRRAHRDHHFYHAQFVRLAEGTGLLMGTSINLFKSAFGSIAVGGESRFGDYHLLDKTPPSLHTSKNGNLRVVLLTPAYFSDGYQPKTDWAKWVGAGKLASVALGKPQPISGWDVVKRQPKPLRHYLPAGSVLFFESATWQDQPFTETPSGEPDFGAIGFGQVALGTW